MIIDKLTQNYVRLKDPDNSNWMGSFSNSVGGREYVEKNVAEPLKHIIMEIWGDTPTVLEED